MINLTRDAHHWRLQPTFNMTEALAYILPITFCVIVEGSSLGSTPRFERAHRANSRRAAWHHMSRSPTSNPPSLHYQHPNVIATSHDYPPPPSSPIVAMADFDISSLSEEQQLALQQYTSVTDQDLAAAVPLLQKCQWNTQIAITRFFDGDADTIDPAAEAARAPPPPPANSRRSETLMDTIPTRYSIRSTRRGLEPAPRVVPTPESQISQPMPFPFNIIFLPFNLTYTIFQRLFGTIGYLFPFLPRLLNRLYSGRALQPSRDTGRRPLNPTDTAARFMREFEEEYGVTHGTLPFHESGYAQAFDLAKRDLKHLLVVLLSPEHDDTAPFVRDTLLSPDLIEYIKDPANNIVLWVVPDPYASRSSMLNTLERLPVSQ